MKQRRGPHSARRARPGSFAAAPPDHFLMRMSPTLAERMWACEFFSREAGPTRARLGELQTDLFD